MDQLTKTNLVIQAIRNLSNNDAEFGLVNGEILSLDWHSEDITKPTDSDIEAEFEKLKLEWESKDYKRKRKIEFEEKHPIGDQLDYIFHHGLAKWKSDIVQPIKDKFPKP